MCESYHAGLAAKKRSAVQTRWEKGETKIIVSTIAFGMGIDKKAVRLIIHMKLPKNIEGYYQQTGRAGRDGKRSKVVLYYSEKDRRGLQFVQKKEKEQRAQK
eukprot:UN27364